MCDLLHNTLTLLVDTGFHFVSTFVTTVITPVDYVSFVKPQLYCPLSNTVKLEIFTCLLFCEFCDIGKFVKITGREYSNGNLVYCITNEQAEMSK